MTKPYNLKWWLEADDLPHRFWHPFRRAAECRKRLEYVTRRLDGAENRIAMMLKEESEAGKIGIALYVENELLRAKIGKDSIFTPPDNPHAREIENLRMKNRDLEARCWAMAKALDQQVVEALDKIYPG
jgi:hypothetical protein